MKKKYINILFAGLVALGISMTSVSAKSFTKEALLEEVSSKDTGYVYIIGKHAFTDNYQIKISDILDAAGTFENVESTDKAIYYINTDNGNVIIIGSEKELNENINITHIDTVPIEDSLGDAIKEAIDTLIEDYNNAKGKYSGTDRENLDEAYETAIAAMEKAADEAAITAARDAYDTTVAELKTDVQKALGEAYIQYEDALNKYAKSLKDDYPTANVDDALDPFKAKKGSFDSIEAMDAAAEDAKKAMDAAVEKVKQNIPVEDIVNGIIANVNKTAGENVLVVSKEDKAITVSLKTSKLPESIGLVGAIRTAMKNYELIDSIVLKYNNAEFVLDDAGWVDGDKAKGSVVAQKINEMFGIMIGKDGNIINLDGKKIEVTYNINEKAKNEEKTVTYTLSFKNDQKVDTDKEMNGLIGIANKATKESENEKLKDAFEVSALKDGKITVTIKNRNLAVADINHTGLATALATLLDNSAYTGIEITEVLAEGAEREANTYKIDTKEGVTTEAIKDGVLNVLGIKENLGQVTGKTVKVTLNYDKTSYKNESASNEYTITFKTVVDPNEYFVKTEHPQSYSFACDSIDEKTGKCVPVLNILVPDNKIANGLDAIANTVINAVKDGSKEVQIKVGTNIEIAKYNKENASQLTVSGRNGLINLITAALNKQDAQYKDLKDLQIIITFIADKDNGYSFVREDATYTLEIGQFVDFDGVMKALVDASKNSDAYNLTMNGHELTLDVKSVNNNVKFKEIIDSLNSVFKENDDKFTIKAGDGIDMVNYSDSDDNSSNISIRSAFWKVLSKTQFDLITPAVMADAKDLVVTLSSKTDGAVAYPGTVGKLVENSQPAEYKYTIHFTVSNLDLNSLFVLKDASGHFTTTYNKENNVYNVALSKITDKLVCASAEDTECVKDSGLMVALQSFAPLFKEISINGTTIDLTSTATIANGVKAVLASYEVATVEDLVKITDGIKVSVTLADNVKATQELTDGKYDFTIKFNADDAIVEFDQKTQQLKNLVSTDSNVERIILTENTSVDNLDIQKDNIEIVGDNNTITGDINITGNNVKLTDVKVSGKVTAGDNTVITGGVITGGLVSESKDLTLNNVVVNGTTDDLSEKRAVIDLTGATGKISITGKDTIIKYEGDLPINGTSGVYSLIRLGNQVVEINGVTINVTNVKNPIEFDTSKAVKDGTKIIGNKFIGDNHTGEGNLARNIISIYDAEAGTITISDNTFDCANWAIRISDHSNNTVTYEISNNIVTQNVHNDATNMKFTSAETALIGFEADNNNYDFKNITVRATGNKINGADFKHYANDYYSKQTDKDGNETDRLYFVSLVNDASFAAEKMPIVNPAPQA